MVVGHGPAKDRAEESRVGRGQGPAASWHALHTTAHTIVYMEYHTHQKICINVSIQTIIATKQIKHPVTCKEFNLSYPR